MQDADVDCIAVQGAGEDNVTAKVDQASEEATHDSLFVIDASSTMFERRAAQRCWILITSLSNNTGINVAYF